MKENINSFASAVFQDLKYIENARFLKMGDNFIDDDGTHFFFKCNNCQLNFLTKNYRIKYCVNCRTKNLKRLPHTRMYICAFCFHLSISKPMAEAHYCMGVESYMRGNETELRYTDRQGDRIMIKKEDNDTG